MHCFHHSPGQRTPYCRVLQVAVKGRKEESEKVRRWGN